MEAQPPVPKIRLAATVFDPTSFETFDTHPKEGSTAACIGARGAVFFGYADAVKRGLLIFPDGWSGLALLILRLSLAGVLAAVPLVVALPPWAPLVSDVLGLALLIGALTRVAATMSAACLIGAGALASGPAGVVLALHGLDAAALALLGAGAYSIDARLFGRRVITLRD